MSPAPDVLDDAAGAFGRMLETFAQSCAGGWARHSSGVSTMVTGFDDPMLNAVLAVGTEPDPALIVGQLADVAATGLPHCLETRSQAGEVAARDLGMTVAATVPLMVLEAATWDGPDVPSAVAIRPLGADEIDLHLSCLASAVGVPRDYFASLDDGTLLRQDDVTAYVAEVDHQSVATGIGIRYDEFVGVANMGTPTQHRRNGYGAAVTARILRDAIARGARWGVLQPSSLGLPVYERLGFRTAETWTVWLPAHQ